MSDNKVTIAGVSAFFFALIPWALAVGAAGWLAFYLGVHQAQREASAEKRNAVAVGEPVPPSQPYRLTLRQRALRIERAEYDGHTLTVYARNTAKVRIYNYCFSVAEKAADGTVIGGGAGECYPDETRGINAGEREEIQIEVDPDKRTTELVLSFSDPLTEANQ